MYHYKECGLENIYLVNGYVEHATKWGPGVSIDDAEGLHRAIGKDLILLTRGLNGKEFRFLRKELDFSQKVVAGRLDVSDQTVANWEKGPGEVPRASDLVLRLLYAEISLGEEGIVQKFLERLDLDDPLDNRLLFTEDKSGWVTAAAA